MILGLGTDIVAIPRLRAALERAGSGARFRDHAFTAEEIAAARSLADPVPRLAGRWAAKEALAKALGTGFGADCAWEEISIVNHTSGAPELHLAGTTLAAFQRLGGKKIHLSISHEQEYACATVILES